MSNQPHLPAVLRKSPHLGLMRSFVNCRSSTLAYGLGIGVLTDMTCQGSSDRQTRWREVAMATCLTFMVRE